MRLRFRLVNGDLRERDDPAVLIAGIDANTLDFPLQGIVAVGH